jgi:ubiquinone/menaquinone biosynthesis C-methylase UbiE
MDRAQFDKFADEYSALHAQNITITGEDPDYFVEYKIRDVYMQILARGHQVEDLRILDFGGGVGNSIPFFRRYFPSCQLVCADVSERSLEIAKRRFGELADYVLFTGEPLPFASGVFHVAFSACVFHHIPTIEHLLLLRELRRVLSNRAGRLFLYEHNPLNPLTVHAVNTCAFDTDAVLIPSWKMRTKFTEAGYSNVTVCYRVFFPRFLKFMRFLEFRLPFLPIGAQYCVAGTAWP